VGVSLQHVFRTSRRGSSILNYPGQTRALFKLRQPVDLVHVLKTVKGLLLLVPSRTPRSSGYDVYAHVVYVVICYMSTHVYVFICCYMLYVCYMLCVCYMSSTREKQEALVMFGYIEESFLVRRTGDTCERHAP
jgi:hypothetical protein